MLAVQGVHDLNECQPKFSKGWIHRWQKWHGDTKHLRRKPCQYPWSRICSHILLPHMPFGLHLHASREELVLSLDQNQLLVRKYSSVNISDYLCNVNKVECNINMWLLTKDNWKTYVVDVCVWETQTLQHKLCWWPSNHPAVISVWFFSNSFGAWIINKIEDGHAWCSNVWCPCPPKNTDSTPVSFELQAMLDNVEKKHTAQLSDLAAEVLAPFQSLVKSQSKCITTLSEEFQEQR